MNNGKFYSSINNAINDKNTNNGDIIEIDIPNRKINVGLTDEELASRRQEMESRGANAWKPENRNRVVSKALQAYAAMASSADKGAVRDLSLIGIK